MNRRWVRGLIWTGVILLGLVVSAVVGLVVGRNQLVRYAIKSSMERQTGLGVRLDDVGLGLADASFVLHQLVISNPPGFGPQPLLSMPELLLRYDSAAAASNVVRLKEVRVHLAELNLHVDRQGRTNLVQVAGGLEAAKVDPTNILGALQLGGIDRLTLTLGRISYTDDRDPRRNVRFDLGITNRTLTNVTSVMQLFPLALEIAFRGGIDLGLRPPALAPAAPNSTR